MSRTMSRNGSIVEGSLVRLSAAGDVWIQGRSWVTVGRVVRDTGFSRPTVRRYLEIMVGFGVAERAQLLGTYIYSMKE